MKKITFEEAKKIVDDLKKIWYEHYKSYKKFDLMNEYLRKNNLHKIIDFRKKAISTHLKEWTGWKGIKDNRTEPQYRLPWYGGYVLAIVFHPDAIIDLPKHKKQGG